MWPMPRRAGYGSTKYAQRRYWCRVLRTSVETTMKQPTNTQAIVLIQGDHRYLLCVHARDNPEER